MYCNTELKWSLTGCTCPYPYLPITTSDTGTFCLYVPYRILIWVYLCSNVKQSYWKPVKSMNADKCKIVWKLKQNIIVRYSHMLHHLTYPKPSICVQLVGSRTQNSRHWNLTIDRQLHICLVPTFNYKICRWVSNKLVIFISPRQKTKLNKNNNNTQES